MRQATEANIFNTANSLAIDPFLTKLSGPLSVEPLSRQKLSSRVKI